MKLQLDVFTKDELVRVCQLVGYKNKDDCLKNEVKADLIDMIHEKVNPKERDIKDQYILACQMFDIDCDEDTPDKRLRELLYKNTAERLEKAISKMSKKKKKQLAEQIEDSLDPGALEELKKTGRSGVAVGGGILVLQGGAIALVGSNLGICMLLTTGLSGLGGILGITFPFAAYTTAAVVGGYVVQAGHFLASPWTAIPLLGVTTYYIYRKVTNKQYINLAGVNYLIECKKQLEM